MTVDFLDLLHAYQQEMDLDKKICENINGHGKSISLVQLI